MRGAHLLVLLEQLRLETHAAKLAVLRIKLLLCEHKGLVDSCWSVLVG